MITRILVFIISILTFYYMFKSVKIMSNKTFNYKNLYFALLFLFGIIYTELYINKIEIYGVLPLFFTSVTIYIFLKLNTKEFIFYILVIYILGVILDIFLMTITNIFFLEKINTYYMQIIFSFIMLNFYIFLSKSKKIINFVKKLYKKFLKINFSIYIIVLLILLYVLFDYLCLTSINNLNVTFFLLILTIFGFISIILFIVFLYQILTLKETTNILIKDNEFYINIINDYRILKHNLINKLLGIKNVSNKKSQKLIDQLILEYNPAFKVIKDIKNIPVGINGIIYEKIYTAEKSESINVKVDNKIQNKILDILSPKNYNLLCESLGVVLDNALDAVTQSKEKILYIKMSETTKKIIIKIENSFQGYIDLEKLGTIDYTSKKNGNGLGLFSLFNKKDLIIKNIIKNNRFITVININKKHI